MVYLLLFAVLLQHVLLRSVHSAALVESSIVHSNVTRWFLEYRPDSIANVNSQVPMVILLHGLGQSMREILTPYNAGTQRWLTVSDVNDFVLIVPNGVNLQSGDTKGDDQIWSYVPTISNYDDVGFISQLVGHAIAKHNVNPSRVYITGISLGGIMTYSLLLQVPELFAAGAAFVANLPSFSIESPKAMTPIMMMNGNKDAIMPYNGGELKLGTIRSAPATRDFWIAANQALTSNVVRTTLSNRAWFDRCRIRSEYYPPAVTVNAASTGSPVQFYIADGGGHNIPTTREFFNFMNIYNYIFGGRGGDPACHDVNGADLAWEFMSQFTNTA